MSGEMAKNTKLNLRALARRLSQSKLPGDVEVVLRSFSEFTGIPLWKIKAIWSAVPSEQHEMKLLELKDVIEDLKAGRIVKA